MFARIFKNKKRYRAESAGPENIGTKQEYKQSFYKRNIFGNSHTVSIGALLRRLDIHVQSASADSEGLKLFLKGNRDVLWPSFILFCLGSWLAGLAIGYGLLGWLGTQMSSEESRFTILLATGLGLALLLFAFLVFIKFKGIFARMLAISVALGSEFMIVFSLAGEGYSPIWAAIVAAVLLVLLARLFTDAAHQIGSSGIFCFMLVFASLTYIPDYAEPFIVILTFPIAAVALFYPMRGLDLRPLGMVFLLCPLASAFYNEIMGTHTFMADVSARIIYVGFFAGLMYLMWTALSSVGKRFMLITSLPIILLGVFMSFGVMASFVVLFMAYMLSSRLVFSTGLLMNILFTILFYINAPVSLEDKGALMLLSGGIVLGLVVWLRHSMNKGIAK